ncbi:hypothetical protein D3C87_337340 [compost metagenome]
MPSTVYYFNKEGIMRKLILLYIVICFSINSKGQENTKFKRKDSEISLISPMLLRMTSNTNSKVGSSTIIKAFSRYFLLTAAHVSVSMDDQSYLWFANSDDTPNKILLKNLTINNEVRWYNHGIADLSMIELKVPENESLKKIFESLAFPLERIYTKKQAIKSYNSDVSYIGYPRIDLNMERFSTLHFIGRLASGFITQNRFDTNTPCVFIFMSSPSMQGCSGSGVYLGVDKGITLGPSETFMIGVMHGTAADSTGGKMAMFTPAFYILDFFTKK